MALEIELLRAPLSDSGLAAIAGTYGAVDSRYASAEFLRRLFNENPAGHSYHAFARDGARAVGHYSVIPIRIRAAGATVLSGKGEALFLDPKHRSTSVDSGNGPSLPGLAMMKSVHERALGEGLALIHSITTPPIGIILRMQGFRALKVALDQFEFLLSGGRAARLISLAQRTVRTAARAALLLPGTPAVTVSQEPDGAQHLAALAGAEDSPGWSISRDLETLTWMRRLGRLQVYAVAGRPEHFALVVRGRYVREILLWSVPPREHRAGLALLSRIVGEAIRDGVQSIAVNPRRAARGGPSLAAALRSLGFLPRRSTVTVYTKSSDDFYLQGANVDFDRLFNL